MSTKIVNEQDRFICLIDESWKNGEDFIRWYTGCEDRLNALLRKYAVVKFCRTGLNSREDFEKFNKVAIRRPLQYTNGNSPRTKLSDNTYTSTEFPSEAFISLHNEMSYSPVYPEKIIFFCLVAPARGGETPVLDGRSFVAKLDPGLAADFTRHRIKYIRNLHGGQGMGLSWQDTFATSDKAAVEQFCREHQLDYTWGEEETLRLEQTGPSVMQHPLSRQEVWFNQADQFHPSNNGQEVYESLKELYEEGNFPIHALFEDDSPIPEATLEHIREVARREMVALPWEKGDLMVMDNIAALHGRNPFEGARSILVSMGDY